MGGAWSYNPGISAVTGTKKGEAALQKLEGMLKKNGHHVTVMENDGVSGSIHGLSGVKDLVTLKAELACDLLDRAARLVHRQGVQRGG